MPLASAQQQQWNYDNSGNWTSTSKTIGNNAATHDAKGNLTAYEINGKEYEVDYDLDNRIIKADIDGDDVEYRYDAFGRRVIRKEGSTKTALIWWANSECAEYKHSSGQTSIQNDLFAHPTRLNAVIARAVEGSKSKLQWYHKNCLLSIQAKPSGRCSSAAPLNNATESLPLSLDHVYAVSDDDGDILEHYRYTAFGEVTIYNPTGAQQTTTQINNQILWNTRRRDEVTGYYMYKFRHYSAELGRWPSRDPIEESGGINLYGFVGNDPLMSWDRLGLEPRPEDPRWNSSAGANCFRCHCQYPDAYLGRKLRAYTAIYTEPSVYGQLSGYGNKGNNGAIVIINMNAFFEKRYPHKLKQQQERIHRQMQKYIKDANCGAPIGNPSIPSHLFTSYIWAERNDFPMAANEHPDDKPQSWHEAARNLGRHVYRARNIEIIPITCGCYIYKLDLDITDTPGISTDSGIQSWFLGIPVNGPEKTLARWSLIGMACHGKEE